VSVRAQWGASALVVDDSDPLQNMDIADFAKPIDLSRGSAEIYEDLKASLEQESYLHRVPGITCEIKHSRFGDDIPCATCPHARPYNVEDPLSRLCKVGREQAALLVEHAAAMKAEAEGRSVVPSVEAEALELAEVCLA
jgi:hypothetical protein